MLCAVLGASDLAAHGPWHEQLARLTAKIGNAPSDSKDLLARAALYTAHGENAAARADIDAAAQLGAPAALVSYARAQVAAAERDWPAAATELRTFREALRQNGEAMQLAATICAARGEKTEELRALRDLLAASPSPDSYVALAQALEKAGQKDEAIACLEKGVTRLGAIPSLVDAAVALEERAQNWTGAIERIENALRVIPGSARWLARKAECEERAGLAEQALRSRRAALAFLDALPDARRAVPANAELAEALRKQIAAPRP